MSADHTPLSVWATGQRQARVQRHGRYTPGSMQHPAKMLPSIAHYAVKAFTRPGDWVLDPMCGIGTTLVEAAHLGRHGLGIELEPRWAGLARANLGLAESQGASGSGQVHTGDSRSVAVELAAGGADLQGGAALLLTSPPYGAMTHGQVRTRRDGASSRVDKWHHRYTAERNEAQLAYQRPDELRTAFTQILAACRGLLRPAAHVVITTRPYRHRGALVDFPSQVEHAAHDAGLVPVQRCAALLCALRDNDLVSRVSFFQLIETRRLRRDGLPVQVISHEDVLVLRNPAPQEHTTAPLPHLD